MSPRCGRLFVATLDATAEIQIGEWLTAQGMCPESVGDGLFTVLVESAELETFCDALPFITSEVGLDEVRLMMRSGQDRGRNHREHLRMGSARRFIAFHRAQWLVKMLHEGRIASVFQPLVEPATGLVRAYECLMRGITEEGTVKMPNEMLSTARDSGLLGHLDQKARVCAIKNAAKADVQGMIFINFNPSAIADPQSSLKSTVEVVSEYGLDPSRILFEVTESESVKDSLHLARILQLYRDKGFRIALDDLGAGYSSLNLLTDLRPDFVKLDMKLIRGIDKDEFKQHVTRSLLDMAKCLEIQTVVEGVETAGEWDWVADHGADLIQGFYFARPATIPPLGPDNALWQPSKHRLKLMA